MKNVITAILNKNINEELKKDSEINLICKDILYQEALLEIIKKNKNIDFLILNSNLPGEKNIIEIIEKIKLENKKIKIICFFKNNNEEISNIKLYRKYLIEEIDAELIKKIIKNKNPRKSKLEKIKKENHLICILGSEGVGKSVFIANIGLCFSKIKSKTIIIDFDSNNTIKYIFNLKNNKKIKEKIEDYIIKINSNLDYINIFENKFNKEKINYILEKLKKTYKNIILDNSNNYKYLDFIIKKSNKKILILEPNIIEIKKTEKILKKHRKYLNEYFIVLNKININSIDEKIIKKIYKNKKIIGKIKYSNKYNLLINSKIKEIIDKKEYLKIIKYIIGDK
ncbi:MAG: hypothetical protein ACI4UE_03710 [Candidatus Scatovivens sp.]